MATTISRSDLVEASCRELPFEPLDKQLVLLQALAGYVCNHLPHQVFVVNGYAGTGKTSVLGAFIRGLRRMKINTHVLAPTGRAAKVAAQFSQGAASTIHRRIFRPIGDGQGETGYILAGNREPDTVFIIDEASMISGGTGRESLLHMLLQHIFSAPGCSVIFVGDTAQLPPVGQDTSPAMDTDALRNIGLEPLTFELTKPVRQSAGSGILYNASWTRQAMLRQTPVTPRIFVTGFDDVNIAPNEELADLISSSWSRVGPEETLIITRSNKRANNINLAVRNLVLGAEDVLQRGERIVISKNNYFWTKRNKQISFLANGETAVVNWFGSPEKMYGKYFVDVELSIPGIDEPIGAKLMLRSLNSEGPSLPAEEMNRFYQRVLHEAPGESLSEKIRHAINDPYYNAIQAKYAYCVTCHKAQGGQWKHVYIDMGGIDPAEIDISYYRWLYTALTRASEKVWFVNPTVLVR